MASKEPGAAQIECWDAGAVEEVAADNWNGRVFDTGEVEGDKVAGEEIEDLHAFAGWEEGEERGGVEEVGYSANGNGCTGRAVGTSIVLGATAESDGFDFQAWCWGG